MTSIQLDDQSGALRLLDLLEHPPDEVVQFLNSAGEPMGTLLIHNQNRTQEYAELVAYADANLAELQRLARTPREECLTTAEVLARARTHAPE